MIFSATSTAYAMSERKINNGIKNARNIGTNYCGLKVCCSVFVIIISRNTFYKCENICYNSIGKLFNSTNFRLSIEDD